MVKAQAMASAVGATVERQSGSWPWLITMGLRQVACKRLADVYDVLSGN